MQGFYFEIKKPRQSGKTTDLLTLLHRNANKRIAFVAPCKRNLEVLDMPIKLMTTDITRIDPQEFDLILVDEIKHIAGCERVAKEWWSIVCGVVATMDEGEGEAV